MFKKVKIFLVLVLLTSICCSNKKKEDKENLRMVTSDSIPKKILIKDESQYSKVFIKSLQDFVGSDARIQLSDSVINFLEHSKPSIKFPQYPKKNKHYTFSATNNLAIYELTVQRINYSDIEFHLVLKKGLEKIFESQGVATISPGFINGAEIFEDGKANGSYAMYGYESASENCTTILYISTPYLGEVDLGARVKEITCADTKVHEIIESMPILRAKIK
ncbi:MAG: hypothetical protein JSR37_10435 [Verrucomicrobia bacterium]|nr:hypothetical protein [Verrucomicrobiota bacterium]